MSTSRCLVAPRRLATRSLVAVAALLVPALSLADTVRMQDGDLVEGEVTDLGDRLEVRTGDLSVLLRWRDVDVVFKEATAAELFRARLAQADRTDVPALYALALSAGRSGLFEEQRRVLEMVVALDADHEGARSALSQSRKDGEWQGGADLLRSKGFVSHDGRWMLAEEAELQKRREAFRKELTDGEQRVDELLKRAAAGQERARKFALEALGGMSPDDVLRPAIRMLRRGTPQERAAAAEVLGRVGDLDVVRPLVFTSIMDRERDVRGAAVKALKQIDHPDTVKPMAKALNGSVPAIRMNAAEALGAFGGGMSVEYLMRRVQSTGGIGSRNHIAVTNQVSYISDFDVEIAQAAQIGDPIVSIIREGIILDTKVNGVVEEWTQVERRVLFTALARATGQDFGEDATAWMEWYAKEGRAALAAAERP